MTSTHTVLSLILVLFQASHVYAFDPSEYRQNTYGPPTRYCDPTKALNVSGAGTLSNPWNLSQCAALPVAGDVVGILPGESVILPASGSHRIPAFQPANSGTVNNRIVYVTKYAAIALPNVATNPNRTELRHNGTAPQVSSDGQRELGTGCPIIGAYFMNYITYDGFYMDMAHAYPATDSGVIRVEYATGTHFRNFEIKGTRTNMQSNPIIYRPQYAVDTVLSNFRAYDFSNDTTGSAVPQKALFSDQYGDRNFLIEKFEIRNTERGIFLKGSAMDPGGVARNNYGTIRLGIVSQVTSCYQFNALDSVNTTTLEYSICHDVNEGSGITLSSETSPAINLLIHHNTVTRTNSNNINSNGGIYSRSNGISPTNVVIRDNLIDLDNGPFGNTVDFGAITGLPTSMNYNAYYKNGANVGWSWNGVQYNSLANWRTGTGREANSRVLSSSPFVNRAGLDFKIVAGHEAKTASSSGGEVGAHASGVAPGVDVITGPGGSTPSRPRQPTNLRMLN